MNSNIDFEKIDFCVVEHACFWNLKFRRQRVQRDKPYASNATQRHDERRTDACPNYRPDRTIGARAGRAGCRYRKATFLHTCVSSAVLKRRTVVYKVATTVKKTRPSNNRTACREEFSLKRSPLPIKPRGLHSVHLIRQKGIRYVFPFFF